MIENEEIVRGPSRSDMKADVTELAAHQAAISKVLRVIASSPSDLQPIFQTIVDAATHLCRADGSTLRLVEKEGVRLVALKASPAVLKGFSFPTFADHDSFVGRLHASKSLVHVPDISELEAYREGDTALVAAVKVGIGTILYVPMLTNDDAIGAFGIWRERTEPFTDRQIELVTDFAAQATIALEIATRGRRLQEVQTALARANRIATIGEMSTSIAHEVNQPLSAIVSNADACKGWLNRESPNLEEARRTVQWIAEDGIRAAEIVSRIRDLVRKAPPKKDWFDMNEAIRDVIVLTRGEAVKNGVSVHAQLTDGLPLVERRSGAIATSDT